MLIGVLKSTNDYDSAGSASSSCSTNSNNEKEGIGNISYALLGPMLVTVNALPFVHVLYTIVERQLIQRNQLKGVGQETKSPKNKRKKTTNVLPVQDNKNDLELKSWGQ